MLAGGTLTASALGPAAPAHAAGTFLALAFSMWREGSALICRQVRGASLCGFFDVRRPNAGKVSPVQRHRAVTCSGGSTEPPPESKARCPSLPAVNTSLPSSWGTHSGCTPGWPSSGPAQTISTTSTGSARRFGIKRRSARSCPRCVEGSRLIRTGPAVGRSFGLP
jgi:hypothetical protein